MVQGINFDASSSMSVNVTFLTYNPNRNIHSPIIKLDSTCNAGLFELQEHKKLKRKEKYLMGADAYNHYKWYNSCLNNECHKLDNGFAGNNNPKLKIFHWSIESGNINAFKIQNVTYQAVSIITSPTNEYWYGANQGPNSSHTFGSRVLGKTLIEHDDAQDGSCKKNNCNECKKGLNSMTKSPSGYIDNKLKKDGQSPVAKAIALLNQKKSILRNGVNGISKVLNYKNNKKSDLKPIFEEFSD